MLERIVRVSCPDRPGLVSALTTAFARRGMNILQLDQFTDRRPAPRTGAPVVGAADHSFFVRAVIAAPPDAADDPERAERAFHELGAELAAAVDDAAVEIRPHPASLRVAVLASQTDHCLQELLRRAQTGQLGGRVVRVVGNHDVHGALCAFHDVPFHAVPHAGLDPAEHERRVLEAVGTEVDVIVLARYMRILSEDFLQRAPAPIINIHHSFLPSFIGANPYQRAHDRGVKMIGATAHYVTADLDEGPIIEQDVTRVDHAHSKDDLVASGADVERVVLCRAVRAHCEGRIFLDGDRTVVLP